MSVHPLTTIGRLGRGLRVVLGALLIADIAEFYLGGRPGFILASVGITVALAVVYALVHVLLAGAHLPHLLGWMGAVLAFAPLILLYGLGAGDGGLIFGAGEGRLGVLTYLGVSLLLAGLRGDPGCEVMTVPALLFRKRTPLPCLFFSPIDWLERKALYRP